MDDELNILPVSSHIRSIAPISVPEVCVEYFHYLKDGLLFIFSDFGIIWLPLLALLVVKKLLEL